MKNEVGVPLSIRKICKVWIGFFPIKIYSGNFSTDLDFFYDSCHLAYPIAVLGFFQGRDFW